MTEANGSETKSLISKPSTPSSAATIRARATVSRAYVFYVDVTEAFSITYTDGLDDENLFEDQVYNGLFPGNETPDFAGECRRDGYVFYGWSPEAVETMSDDTVFTVQWKRGAPANTSEDESAEPVFPDSSEPSASSDTSESTTPSTSGDRMGAAALTLLGSAGILVQFIVRGRRKQAPQ